jgi:hypothetical protein
MVNPNRFYTYAYLREDRTPYYIGKGEKDRIYSTNRKINKPKDISRIIFLKQNLIEAEAFRHEIYMIAVFGRIDLGTGILYNMTDGGEGSSGRIHSEETKKKLSEAHIGKPKPHLCKQFQIINPEGKVIDGVGITKFCNENNLNYDNIRKVLNGTQREHKGWTKPSEEINK